MILKRTDHIYLGVIKIKCPICKELYDEDNDMVVLETRKSVLGLAVIVTLGCEDCGFIGEVKVHPDDVKKLE